MFIPNGDTHSTHGVLRVRPFYIKKTPPKSPMGVNPQEDLAKSDETRNVQNPIGSQVMQLETIGIKQAPNGRMQRKSKPTVEESMEASPLVRRRRWNRLITRKTDIARHHHAISNQRIQISSPERRPLPLAGHLGRLDSSTGALGHRSHSSTQKIKDEGSGTRRKQRKRRKAMNG